jgi:hypothetical protein
VYLIMDTSNQQQLEQAQSQRIAQTKIGAALREHFLKYSDTLKTQQAADSNRPQKDDL